MDLPTDDPPAIVNAICGSGLSKKMGEPDMNGFIATIMDLIDRNYLLINDTSSNDENLNSSCSLFLEINSDYDSDTLWEFEVEILNFLKEYEQDGIISMDLVSEGLKYVDDEEFSSYPYKEWRNEFESNIYAYMDWKNEVRMTLLEEDNFKDAFYSKVNKYLKIF